MMKKISKGRSSEIINRIFGDTSFYSRILKEKAQQLSRKKPYTQTFKLAFEQIKKARDSLPPEWKNLNKITDNTEKFLKQLEVELK